MKKISLLFVFQLLLLCSWFHLSAQTWKWATGSRSPYDALEAWVVAVDGSGNVYSFTTAGSICYFGTFTITTPDGILVCTDSNGVYKWVMTTGHGFVSKIARGPADDVFLFGTFSGLCTMGGYTISTGSPTASFCARVTSSGAVMWLKKIAEGIDNYTPALTSGNADGSGDAYIAGSFNSANITIGTTTLTNSNPAGGSDDVYLVKLDPSGNQIWARSFGGDSTEDVSDVAVTPPAEGGGGVYVAGSFKSHSFTFGPSVLTDLSAAVKSFYLVKYSSSGTPIWGDSIAAPAFSSNTLNGIDVDPQGNVYIAGGCGGILTSGSFSFTPYGTYIVKFRNDGTPVWGETMNDPRFEWNNGIAADACGNIFTIGTYVFYGHGGDNSFIFRYDSSGTFLDSVMIGAGGDDNSGITVDNKGNFYVGGDYMVSNLIGSDSLILYDSYEALFLAKYAYPMCTLTPSLHTENEISSAPAIVLYPNPASNEFTISLQGYDAALSKAELFDLTGRLIGIYKLSGNSSTIALKNIDPGIYFCKIYTTDNAATARKLIVTK